MNNHQAIIDLMNENDQLRADLAASRDLCSRFEASVGEDIEEIFKLRNALDEIANGCRRLRSVERAGLMRSIATAALASSSPEAALAHSGPVDKRTPR